MKCGPVFHTVSWSSHKSKRQVLSIEAAKIDAAGEAINEVKLLAGTLSTVLVNSLHLQVLLDSRDMFLSLDTKRISTYKSIRPDVYLIRY